MKQTSVLLGLIALTWAALTGAVEARTWTVKVDGSGDVATIQAAINAASAGDVVLVGPGRYTWANQGTGTDYGLIQFMRGRADFTVVSELGASATILDAQSQGRVVYFQGLNNVTFEGFTVTGGEAPSFGYYTGGGITAHLGTGVVRDCVITGNSAQNGGGMWIGGVSSMRLEGCEISWNEAVNGGGVYFVNSSSSPTISGCVVKHNTASGDGGALYGYRSNLTVENTVLAANRANSEGGAIYKADYEPWTLTNCTIAENFSPVGAGIHLAVVTEFDVTNTIISRNKVGAGLSLDPASTLQLTCSNIFGNTGGDALPAGVVDLGGNFSLEPDFCGEANSLNYELQGDSPCVEGNHPDAFPCGLIGALPPGCGGVPAEKRTWGHIKSLYRNRSQ